MGKYIVLVAFAAALTLAILMGQSRSTAHETVEEQVDRQEKMIARQIARSAFSTGASEVKRDFCDSGADIESLSRTDVEDQEENGTFDLSFQVENTAAGVEECAEGDDRVVELVATAQHGAAEYRIAGTLALDISPLFSALTIDGAPDEIGVSGEDTNVLGLNPNEEGSDRHGVGISDADAAARASQIQSGSDDGLCAGSSVDEEDANVRGVGGTCDVIHDSEINTDRLVEEVRDTVETESSEIICSNSGGDDSVGDMGEPAIIKSEGDCIMKGDQGGTGILFVEGDLEMQGEPSWNGLVLIASGGSFETNPGGEPTVRGSVVQVGDRSVELNGEPTIQYDPKKLQNLINLTDDGIIQTPQITARAGDLCGSTCPSIDDLLDR